MTPAILSPNRASSHRQARDRGKVGRDSTPRPTFQAYYTERCTMPCVPCNAMLHDFCDAPILGGINESGTDSCCCWKEDGQGQSSPRDRDSANSGRGSRTLGQVLSEALNGEASLPSKVGRPRKDGEDMHDVLSTGRKRAVIEKPITEGAICEWAGLKFAGGGVVPIIGCAGNRVVEERGKYARHHGPDKNVLNNSPENLHLICVICHNRWHTLNDPFYGDGTGASRPAAGETWVPNTEWREHDPVTLADSAEILAHEAYWKTPKKERGTYRA